MATELRECVYDVAQTGCWALMAPNYPATVWLIDDSGA